MPGAVLLDFYSYIDEFSDDDYLISILSFNLAPIIHKKKIGGLVNLSNSKRKLKDAREENKEKIPAYLGLDVFVLREKKDSILLYFFRERALKKELGKKNIQNFLKRNGYNSCTAISDYLNILKGKFEYSCPNEVGVFLGYPLSDIIFFDKGGRKDLISGYWRCYSNEKKAKRTFLSFDRSKIEEFEKLKAQTSNIL